MTRGCIPSAMFQLGKPRVVRLSKRKTASTAGDAVANDGFTLGRKPERRKAAASSRLARDGATRLADNEDPLRHLQVAEFQHLQRSTAYIGTHLIADRIDHA
ncbi:hypothetical protein LMG26411_03666 [Cupriavidus numazuensis]|uniref:Uncharacterized protein n=1 Tax=Cupriavidus numazuensis TaxID=221992 RepID=A0ABM8TJA4_9BURK|nr:hypothetical protein LMG26411_03666 [Cupriavidus numazuensis]